MRNWLIHMKDNEVGIRCQVNDWCQAYIEVNWLQKYNYMSAARIATTTIANNVKSTKVRLTSDWQTQQPMAKGAPAFTFTGFNVNMYV